MPDPCPLISHPALAAAGLSHGFFGRVGGVSTGIYASLNCGLGSRDDKAAVRENRARALAALDVPNAPLLTPYQVHSPLALVVREPWPAGEPPQADALVTDVDNLAIGVLAADCAPALLADAEAGVIGAAHAGWKGALGGVLEAAVEAMVGLGAAPGRIVAVIGPCIGPDSYEVGPEFPAPFIAQDAGCAVLFRPAPRDGHFLFDLPSYCRRRLSALGLARVELSGHDTFAAPERFFSYRQSRRRDEPDYGRNLSAIVLR
ncbi:MAG: peptidoglycan editing factor PgeF [Alphaproteobacteria bacterium]